MRNRFALRNAALICADLENLAENATFRVLQHHDAQAVRCALGQPSNLKQDNGLKNLEILDNSNPLPLHNHTPIWYHDMSCGLQLGEGGPTSQYMGGLGVCGNL